MFLIADIPIYEITIYSLFNAFCIILGFIVLSKLMWLCYYELKYKKGDEYLQYGKKYFKNKKLYRSTRNKGIKK